MTSAKFWPTWVNWDKAKAKYMLQAQTLYVNSACDAFSQDLRREISALRKLINKNLACIMW